MKPDVNIRICGDYSLTPNKCMKLVKYPLPSIEDIIARVGDGKVFSKIDLESAYLELPLDDESKVLTSINTKEGLYQFNYSPFGISSSPGILKSFMCKVLSGIDNIIIYQDDILIMTSTKHQHGIILDKVLQRLRETGIKLKINICSFYVNSVNYLEYIFDKDSVGPNIIDALTPVNVKLVQSFLGLCNYYHCIILNFSTIFAPLCKLLKKNILFKWGKEQEKCFNL